VDSVEDKIRGLLVKSFDMKPEEITPETNLKDDLEMDSLEMVEVVVALEDEFDIKLDDGVISNKQSFGDVVKTIEGKLKK